LYSASGDAVSALVPTSEEICRIFAKIVVFGFPASPHFAFLCSFQADGSHGAMLRPLALISTLICPGVLGRHLHLVDASYPDWETSRPPVPRSLRRHPEDIQERLLAHMPRLRTPTDLQVLAMTHPSCWLPLRSQRRHPHLLLHYGAKLPLGTVISLRRTCISVYASSLPFLLTASLALSPRSSRDLSVYSSG